MPVTKSVTVMAGVSPSATPSLMQSIPDGGQGATTATPDGMQCPQFFLLWSGG